MAIPPELPERLRGPEIGAECVYRSPSFPDGVRAVVTARSYVWAPGDRAYRGGSRRYDWKVIRILGELPPFWGSRARVVDDATLSPIEAPEEAPPTCDLCGHTEDGPGELPDNWNGDTGNHRSCEARERERRAAERERTAAGERRVEMLRDFSRPERFE
jgi:hypothetical protein